ncbi:hypothetical protein SAMD00019534_099360, partial [Acytostelium subglobosum LB1]|uniref:hypothetical protein n=1 Tax=Acytostelium subglobosum LB1 TaxID=1410327 RepID=UPI0006448422
TFIVVDQDKLLDSLSYSVTRQKEIAINIGREAESQGIMLDDLNSHVDTTTAKLKNATRGVVRLAQESRTTGHWICICILLVVLILVSALAMS